MQSGFAIPDESGQEVRSKTGSTGQHLTRCSLADDTAGPFHEPKASINEIIEMTGAIPLFDKIESEQIGAIAAQMRVMRLDEGQQLFAEGEHGDYICFIVSGTLEVVKRSQHGHMVYVSTLHRGRSIGEMALTDSLPRSATVIAQTPCTLLVIAHEGFDQILENSPRAGVSLLKSLSRVLSLNLRRVSGELADAREPAGSIPFAPVLKEEVNKKPGLIDHILNGRPAAPPPMVRRFI